MVLRPILNGRQCKSTNHYSYPTSDRLWLESKSHITQFITFHNQWIMSEWLINWINRHNNVITTTSIIQYEIKTSQSKLRIKKDGTEKKQKSYRKITKIKPNETKITFIASWNERKTFLVYFMMFSLLLLLLLYCWPSLPPSWILSAQSE